MRSKHITLNDIAKKLNVSTVTISKALRGHPDISHKTTKLIRQIADEMGYSPNFMARNLSARKSNTIGVVIPKIAHHFFSSIIEHIYNYAFDQNYEIILTVSQENQLRERKHIQTLLSMRVDGMIISISQETKDYDIFNKIKERGIPIVFIDRTPNIPNSSSVTVNDRQGAFMATENAIKLGYKNIAHFAGNRNINIGRERLNGFQDAMKSYGLEIKPGWIIEGGFGEKSGYDTLKRLYNENNLPDFIFAVTYPVALGIYMAAQELKLKIPDDIDIICFGNSQVQSFLSPPLSCVDQPTEELAVKALQILIDNIDNKDTFEPKQFMIDTNLIIRNTCTKFNRSK
jgi:LacI family transcriptional regulator